MTVRLTLEQQQLARRLHAKVLSLLEIGRRVGCWHEVVRTVVRRESKRRVRSQLWQPGPGRLTLADREEISLGMRAGDSFTEIAARLGRAVSTVTREVARDCCRTALPGLAGAPAGSRPCASSQDAEVEPSPAGRSGHGLAEGSVVAAGDRRPVRLEFADDPMVQVSPETIYQALFVQGRGDLRRELARCLRTDGSSGGRADAWRTPASSATWS